MRKGAFSAPFLWAGVLRKAGAQPDGKRQKLMRGAAENMVKWVRL